MLLKEVPGLLPRLESSPLTTTEMWNANVKDVIPAQLVAYRKVIADNHPDVNIDRDINFMVYQVQLAEMDGLLTSPLATYAQPVTRFLLVSELVKGLKSLQPVYRLAFLFGMETGYSSMRIAMLTYQQALQCAPNTEIAHGVIKALTPSMRTPFAFWRDEGEGVHLSLDDLETEVYTAFGRTWRDLAANYTTLVPDEHYSGITLCA